VAVSSHEASEETKFNVLSMGEVLFWFPCRFFTVHPILQIIYLMMLLMLLYIVGSDNHVLSSRCGMLPCYEVQI
jgi:hypothetical protein